MDQVVEIADLVRQMGQIVVVESQSYEVVQAADFGWQVSQSVVSQIHLAQVLIFR